MAGGMSALLSVLFIALVAVARAEEAEVDGDVVVLTDATHNAQIQANELIYVEYYAPWCGHCKALAPEYAKAATLLKGKVVVAKLDATANEQTAQEAGIRGFPTIRLFIKGVAVEYTGARTAEALVSFAEKASKPAVTVLETKEAVDAFFADNAVSVVAFFAGEAKEGALTKEIFEQVANQLRAADATFALAPSAEALGLEAGVTAAAVLRRKADGETLTLKASEGVTAELFTRWVRAGSLPFLGEIGPQNYQDYLATELPMLWLALDPAADNTAVKELFTKLAREYNGVLVFFWIDNAKYSGQGKQLGLSGKVIPAAVITSAQAGRFVFDEATALTEENVRPWLEKFKAGTLEPFVKSQPIPETNDDNVKVIVGKTFKSIVSDATKDVLVEFYAEYCGHCKALAPVYEELGRILKPVGSFVVAKVNVPENDVTAQIKGFPTIILYPANNKEEIVEYEGDRSLGSLLDFARKHASIAMELPKEAQDILLKYEAEHPAQQEEADEDEAEGEKEEL